MKIAFRHFGYVLVVVLISAATSMFTWMHITSFTTLEVIKSNNLIAEQVTNMQAALNIVSVKKLQVTSYSPTRAQTDSTPFINACGQRVALGQVAVSDNLWYAGWTCGTKIWVDGFGIYTVMDRMNSRFEDRIDIFQFSTRSARRFGLKEKIVIRTRL